MALKTMLDNLDEVADELHEHYEEREIAGKNVFVLDLKGLDDHPNVRGLSTALADAKKKKEENRRKVEELEARIGDINTRFDGLPDDFDVDTYSALKAAAEGKDMPDINKIRESAEKQARERAERREEQIRAEYEAKIGGMTKYKDFAVQNTVEGGLSRALDEAGVDSRFKRGALALLEAKGDVQFVEDDEGFRATVESEIGEIDLARWVRDWAESEEGKPYIAQPKGGDEPGSRGGSTGGFSTNPFAARDWSKTAQSTAYRNDPAKAARMAKAAGFKDLDAGMKASRAPAA